MVKFRFMMGVVPGFNHGNRGMTPEKAIKTSSQKLLIAMFDWENLNGDKPNEVFDYEIIPAKAIYPDTEDLGCPYAGEIGVLVEGECKDSDLPSLESRVKYLARALSQETITIEVTKDGDFAEIIHVCDTGNEVKHYDYNIEQFTASLNVPDETDFCRFLQEYYKNNSLPFEKYVITGIVSIRDGHIEFAAVQNPAWGQEDIDQYRADMLEIMYTLAVHYNTTIKLVLKDEELEIDPSSPEAKEKLNALADARLRKFGVKPPKKDKGSWDSSDSDNNWKKWNPSR